MTNFANQCIIDKAVKEKGKSRAVGRHFDYHKSRMGVIAFYGIHIVSDNRVVTDCINKKVNRPPARVWRFTKTK